MMGCASQLLKNNNTFHVFFSTMLHEMGPNVDAFDTSATGGESDDCFGHWLPSISINTNIKYFDLLVL